MELVNSWPRLATASSILDCRASSAATVLSTSFSSDAPPPPCRAAIVLKKIFFFSTAADSGPGECCSTICSGSTLSGGGRGLSRISVLAKQKIVSSGCKRKPPDGDVTSIFPPVASGHFRSSPTGTASYSSIMCIRRAPKVESGPPWANCEGSSTWHTEVVIPPKSVLESIADTTSTMLSLK
ncbi:unnamed protein product [Heterosigma akashiwo]